MIYGGPIDMTPFGVILQGIGALYWIVTLAAAGFALWLPRRWWVKVPLAAVVLAAFIYPVATRVQAGRQQHDEAKAKLDKAMALFEERCKTAGERIVRTVDNVEGVVWMKWRPSSSYREQFALDDPYGRDCSGEVCILRLLRVTKGEANDPEEARKHRRGYSFVESIDPGDGNLYRFIGVLGVSGQRTPEQIEEYKKNSNGRDPGVNIYRFALERERISQFSARYGVDWNDISNREDRERWIAGGEITIVDLQSKETIAQRVGYLIDTGQGSVGGSRKPWAWARSYAPRCPSNNEPNFDFAMRIVNPTQF